VTLLALQDVSIAFGGPPVLDRASLAIERGDRVCLLGRNGAGKSTLLQLLDGTIAPDAGAIVRPAGVSVARLAQDIPDAMEGTLFDVVAGGLGELGALLAAYHQASHAVAVRGDERALRALDRLHERLDAAGAWQRNSRVAAVLERLGLDPDQPFAAASGGRKRQALLARALVREPDLLVLDEPTNHLDIAAIEWLERLLADAAVTLVFVTHDRAFLRRVATRIVELDRGRLADWGPDHDRFLERKAEALHAEAREREAFDRRLAQEEVWIRTGVQARRTRNEGRVRALEAMRVARAARREREGTASLQLADAERSGRLVVEARDVSFAHDGRPLVRGLTTVIRRGDRVGLIGPNGAGKTTLLRLLLGELAPQAGSVRLGTGLRLAYFDQLRAQLDPDATVFASIADGAEFVEVGGQRRHVNGWLQEFLFAPDRARTPVRALSGGERHRLLLARLFTRPCNLLVLDEPTNDLDLETLELLEDRLLAFDGTLLLVSHDRAFLDAVVTSTLAFEGDGRVREYAGGYEDWVRQRPAPDTPPASGPVAGPRRAVAPAGRPTRRKLTFKEAGELAGLPARIDALEQARAALYVRLADPATHRAAGAAVSAQGELATVEAELAAAMSRWEELETLAAGAPGSG
jgi:ATP-binding cassette subfamily F protein uup